MFLSFLFFAFLAYLGYKLLVGVVLPIYRTTRQVRKTFQDMNAQMRSQTTPPNGTAQQPQAAESKPRLGEYIDFEEVKE